MAIFLLYWLFMSPKSQLFGEYRWKAETNNKIVALTFDDGPNEPYTSQILDILDKYKVKATFFQVGTCIEKYPKITRRIFSSGHTIGNHSLSHEFHNYFLSFNFKHEILENQAILQKYIGNTPALYRSPWLWRQPFMLKTVRTLGLTPISGKFCHPLEVMQIDGKKIANKAIKIAKPGSIIIFHDGRDGKGGNRGETVKAVDIVIDRLIKDGYELVAVDKLLGIPAYQ